MANYKKKIADDLKNNLDVNLTFNTSQLEKNKRRGFSKYRINKIVRNTVSLVLAGAFLTIIMIPIMAMFDIDHSTKMVSRKYSQSELSVIESNSFNKLNDINYPSLEKKYIEVDDEYKEAIYNFAYNIYINSLETESNYLYSPLSLYSLLDVISLGTSNEEIIKAFDDVLGVNSSDRNENYAKMYENNYYINDNGTLQMYNGLFLYNDCKYNQEHINDVSNKYVEAFQLDFDNDSDVDKLISWVNKKLQSDNLFKKSDLELDGSLDDKSAFYFSTMYFNNKWANTYSKKDTYKGKFYLIDGSKTNVYYMNHKYRGEVYDYDTYYAFYDYYKNGSKIKYFYPKNDEDNIFENDEDNIFELMLNNDVNFLYDDESSRVYDYYAGDPVIDLTVPKFSYSTSVDFSSILQGFGLSSVFDRNLNSMDRVFDGEEEKGINNYIQFVRQKNQIEFNEDGTTVSTVSFAGMGTESAAPMDTLVVKLERPFVYVIYDSNDLPLYIGSVSNPNSK